MCLSQVRQGMVKWCHHKALLNRGAEHTITKTKTDICGLRAARVMFNEYKTLCDLQKHSLLQALSGKRVEASLSGQSSLLTLCLLVSSQGGQ